MVIGIVLKTIYRGFESHFFLLISTYDLTVESSAHNGSKWVRLPLGVFFNRLSDFFNICKYFFLSKYLALYEKLRDRYKYRLAFCKLLRVVTITNLRHEYEFLNSIICGLPLCSFFLGFPLMLLKEEFVEYIFYINCFFFGSTRFLSKGLDSNIFQFFAECLLNRFSLFGGSIGEAYEDVGIFLIGFGIRIPFFF